MQQDVKIWWEQAQADLRAAQFNLTGGQYFVAAFLSQQAVEKALKALIIKKTNTLVKIHDLVILGRKAGLDEALLKKSELLSKVYIESRYGIIGDTAPSKKFTKENTAAYLSIAEEILSWVQKKM